MKIAIWETGHEIADTVAQSLSEGLDAKIYTTGDAALREADAHIGYGILRGMHETFKDADRFGMPWFNVDKGYTNPSHYDGNYRISYRGTQFKWHAGIPRKPIDLKLEPMRTTGNYVLVCPPTQAVCDFFGIDNWIAPGTVNGEYIWRTKDCQIPIAKHLSRAKAVITFNSSVGWQALQMGIPVLSDVNHSAVGSFYNCTDLKTLTDNFLNLPDNRLELFEAMAAHQLTLAEIEQGKAWPILEHYTSGWDGMAEKPLSPMLQPIVSSSAHAQTLKSIYSNTEN